MDTTKFDAVARIFGSGMTRREAVRGLVTGAATVAVSGALLAYRGRCGKQVQAQDRKKNKKQMGRLETAPRRPVNVCAGKNWCIDRSQTCGPAGGYGKCLVDASGGNICAEILFQVQVLYRVAGTQLHELPLRTGGGRRRSLQQRSSGYDLFASAKSETSRPRGSRRWGSAAQKTLTAYTARVSTWPETWVAALRGGVTASRLNESQADRGHMQCFLAGIPNSDPHLPCHSGGGVP